MRRLFWSLTLLAHGCPRTALAQSLGSWASLGAIDAGILQEHSTVALSATELATVGGLLGTSGGTTDAFLIYDIPGNKWRTGPKLPVALNHPNTVSVGSEGTIYVVGGLGGASGWPASPAVFRYSRAADAWTSLTPMAATQARGGSAVGVYNGTIYVAGGIPGLSGRTVATVTAYDTATDSWITSLPPLPEPRDHVGGAVVDGKFYVVGGRDSGVNNVRDTVFVLDLEDVASGWRTSAARMPTARGGIASAVVGTRIYTFGGEGNRAAGARGVFGQSEVYDAATDEWASLADMQVPRHGTSAVAIGARIFIPGGATVQGQGAVDVFDVFTP